MSTLSKKYLAIDPGGTTGWATFGEDGLIIDKGMVPEKEFNEWLKGALDDVVTIICEDYRNFAWKKQVGFGRNETSKLIGKIELLADMKNIPVVLQQPSIKAIGYKWAGLKPVSNHALSHDLDAVVHGVYWLQTNGIRKPGVAIKEKDK